MYSRKEIIDASNKLGVKFDKFDIQDLTTGIEVELEHGEVNPTTNVTNDDLILTMKIALAHLNEFPNYYNKDYGLLVWVDSLKSKRTYYLK